MNLKFLQGLIRTEQELLIQIAQLEVEEYRSILEDVNSTIVLQLTPKTNTRIEMETKGLMIGSYVTVNDKSPWKDLVGHPVTVIGIEEWSDKHFPDSDSIVKFRNSDYKTISMTFTTDHAQINEFIDPIKLTEGWMINLGYQPYKKLSNHFINNGHIIWHCNGIFICDKNGTVLNYVHELQLLFFGIQKKQLKLTEL